VGGSGGRISLKTVGAEMLLVGSQLDGRSEQPNCAVFAPRCWSAESLSISHVSPSLGPLPSRQQQTLMLHVAFDLCTFRLPPSIPVLRGTPQKLKRNERIKEAESIWEIILLIAGKIVAP